ncbi:MAG: glycosyltransferase family 2 protein [Lachnospiraceae bacterium]|nr:glycosyltransferase family 2 protein [Lachnospiraceae bacterium]
MRVLVLFTCYNRREKSEKAVRGLLEGNPGVAFSFIAVDAGSDDGTGASLREIPGVEVIRGDASMYYSIGMRVAMERAKELAAGGALKDSSGEDANGQSYDCCMLMNDDVEFFPDIVERMAASGAGKRVIVGPTCGDKGELTYGGIKYDRGIHYHIVGPDDENPEADTFNANCVLMPMSIFLEADIMDGHYVHTLGDFDYGLMLKRRGCDIRVFDSFIGRCNDNPKAGTWQDRSLSRRERIRKKESIKGAPYGQWFYYLKKNFGIFAAVRSSLTPYIRILLGM